MIFTLRYPYAFSLGGFFFSLCSVLLVILMLEMRSPFLAFGVPG